MLRTVAIICALSAMVGSAAAATCPPAGSISAVQMQRNYAERIASSELVFVGRVSARRSLDLAEASMFARQERPSPATRIWFDPQRVLKGSIGDPASLFFPYFVWECITDPSMQTGDLVLVYADRHNGYWLGRSASLYMVESVEALLR